MNNRNQGEPDAVRRRVMLVGWDAADWQVINPLLEQGKMPALQRLLDRGVRGNIATLQPVLSPMLWTSIATGKRPFKHGIHGFTEPTPDGKGVRPVTNLARKTKAIWNILSQTDRKSIVVGWWPSNPAEPINGVMVSNDFQHPHGPRKDQQGPTSGADWVMKPGTVHPARLAEHLAEFRVSPEELTAEHLLPFVPKLAEIDQKKDRRLVALAKNIAETSSIQAAATALMQLEPWDLLAVYFDGIDHFCHGFMKYHPPRQSWVSEADFEIYSGVIESAYRFHDMMLGTLMELAGPETTIILMSDHGFRSDHLRPAYIPAEPAGPAVEHRDFGILCAAGPDIRKNEVHHGASLLDICPTLLTMFGLPVGADMDGKPLLSLFEVPPEVERIPSWDDVDGEAGLHPPEMQIDATEDAAALQQMVDLGYIEPLNEDQEQAVKECVRELQYNLARAHVDAGQYGEGARILEELWASWPSEHRFGINLIGCYGALGEAKRRREAIEQLADRIQQFAKEAREELEELKPRLEEFGMLPGVDQDAEERPQPPKRFTAKIRRLQSLAAPRGAQILWFRATQALLEGDAAKALDLLEPLLSSESNNPILHLQFGSALLRLGRATDAQKAFEAALALDPDHAGAHAGRAEALARQRDWEGVLNASLDAVERIYFNPKVHTLLGRALMRLGKPDEAETALQVAITQAPGFVRAHRSLAILYGGMKKNEKRAADHRRMASKARAQARMRRGVQRAAMANNSHRTPERSYSTAVPKPLPGIGSNEIITIVSGLPRSGTSMMMQMLALGGLEPYTDSKRGADADNQRGYFEHERVMQLQRDATWLDEARGKVVKVVAPLLQFLPDDLPVQVVFMERDIDSIVASQTAMLERLERDGGQLGVGAMKNALQRQLKAADALLRDRPLVRVLHVSYDEAVNAPKAVAKQLGDFMGEAFNVDGAAGAVEPALRRQTGTQSETESVG